MVVHPRFSHFFLMLWFVCKIDHVVRNCSRCWVDSTLSSGQGSTVAQMCREYESQASLFQRTHAVFVHGLSHVTLSLSRYIQESRMPCSDEAGEGPSFFG